MSRNRVLLVVILLACIGAPLAILIIDLFDKEGNLQLAKFGLDLLVVLILLPYVVIAGVAVWNRERGIVLAASLLAVTVIAALAISIGWSDHDRWRRTPPHQEFQRMAILEILLVEWVGSVMLLALAVGYRLYSALSSGCLSSAEPHRNNEKYPKTKPAGLQRRK